MIQDIITYKCTRCGSENIRKNGYTSGRKQKFHCKDCNRYGTLFPFKKYTEEKKEAILKAYEERTSMRGIQRVFGPCYHTLSRWLKEKNSKIKSFKNSLIKPSDKELLTLELDEMYSFVQKKKNTKWIWGAIDRKTHQIVAYVIGDRSFKTCNRLWNKIPYNYKNSICYSDFWRAYKSIIPSSQLHQVGKDSGETSHIERFWNIIRQRLGRFVRRTLSFSKKYRMHVLCLRLFIYNYNLNLKQKLIS